MYRKIIRCMLAVMILVLCFPVRAAAENIDGTIVLPTSKIVTVYINSDVKYDLDYVRSNEWNLVDDDTGEYYYTVSDESTENRLVLQAAVRSVQPPGEEKYYYLFYPVIKPADAMHYEFNGYYTTEFPGGYTYALIRYDLEDIPSSVTLKETWNEYSIVTCVLNKGTMYKASDGTYHGAGDSGISSMRQVTTEAYFRFTPGSSADETDFVPKAPSGYRLEGWYKDSALTEKVSFPIDVSKDVTIYAKYAKVYKEGWVKNSTGKRYRLTDGTYLKNCFKKIGGKTYYFMKNGYAATGWKTIASKRYHFAASGVMNTGWKKISGRTYYFSTKGVMQKGWKKISGKQYHFNAKGVMDTGWKIIAKKRYYFTAKGVMVTGWQKISKKWYYFNKKGAMLKGWQKISKKWYYFGTKGVMTTGWKKLSGKWYYFMKNGVMATGTLKIGKKTYSFSSSGVCLNP